MVVAASVDLSVDLRCKVCLEGGVVIFFNKKHVFFVFKKRIFYF